MVCVEEARHVEVGANILDHDIWRIPPAPDRDIAIGLGKAFEGGPVGGPNNLDASARGVGEPFRFDPFRPGEIGAQHRSNLVLTGLAAIRQPRSKDRARPGIEPEASGSFW